MRIVRTVLLTAMMVMASTFVIANDNNPSVRVEKIGLKSMVVFTSGFGEDQAKIQLKNENGIVLYSTLTEKSQDFAKKFDLTSLNTGNYMLEIENASSFTATPVSINADSAWVNINDQVTIIKPVIRKSGLKLDIIMPSNEHEDVLITIYDNKFRKIATEVSKGESLKRFDLSKLKQGAYVVKMKTRGRNFVQSVSIK